MVFYLGAVNFMKSPKSDVMSLWLNREICPSDPPRIKVLSHLLCPLCLPLYLDIWPVFVSTFSKSVALRYSYDPRTSYNRDEQNLIITLSSLSHWLIFTFIPFLLPPSSVYLSPIHSYISIFIQRRSLSYLNYDAEWMMQNRQRWRGCIRERTRYSWW